MMDTVQVLLATYNGERFLQQQIDSVLAQQDVAVTILAHDDGSTDGTLDILRGYVGERFTLLDDGVRCGSAKANFRHLVRESKAEYVAFCDQDDVWMPNKLRTELDAMLSLEVAHGTETPLLVYSDLRVVNDALHTQNESLWQANGLHNAQAPTFAQLLTENVVTGCTALLNRALADRTTTMPDEALMHDHWAALLASSLGAMQAIPQATVLYRQHGGNVVGAIQASSSPLAKVARLLGSEGAAARARQATLDRTQAAALLEQFGEQLPEDARATLQAFLDLPQQSRVQRLQTLSRYGLWRVDAQRKLAQAVDQLR